MAEWLSRVDVGHMYLYAGLFDRGNRIAERVAVMGISTSIDYDAVIAFQRFVNFVDQSAFVARVYSCGGFPHEIGLFLGYPIDDVISFIENKGKNFKCCGCWKVYHDEDNAKKTFEKYKKCTNIYCKKYLQGSSLKRLTV